MRKLANISQFEHLQSQANRDMGLVSEMTVFNTQISTAAVQDVFKRYPNGVQEKNLSNPYICRLLGYYVFAELTKIMDLRDDQKCPIKEVYERVAMECKEVIKDAVKNNLFNPNDKQFSPETIQQANFGNSIALGTAMVYIQDYKNNAQGKPTQVVPTPKFPEQQQQTGQQATQQGKLSLRKATDGMNQPKLSLRKPTDQPQQPKLSLKKATDR